ncbi:ferredoxin [Oceanisphaera litoralis]|uniref:class I ribonucleotide reductase maintenance protein YfaE n=1 Tax=Oceanisphaera litoralis TaxID=225144 RepID=UPI0019592650|nr:ferredoxin [Oceanisphaera litoralis]
MSRICTRALNFELRADETLLEGLERTGHAVEYQCRSGYCGACRTPLLEGAVSYPHPPLAFVTAGDILPCCCRPQGDITLDIDAEPVKKQA